ncbi:MAG: peptidase domain-containing ABC transporter [Alphaproteobacteria bacterium]|nr:peptidase domain-containing ABC transporter [Alphaproteobacteria bacterium]
MPFGKNKETKPKEEPKAQLESGGAEGAAAGQQSGLRALASVARHMGLDWSLTRLMHLHARDHEPDGKQLVRIARAEGMKAALHRANWKELARSQKLAPFLVRLNTGAWFVAVKVGDAARQEGEPEQVMLFNPLVPEANLFAVPKDKFLSYWSGDVILLKRTYKAGEKSSRFGLNWFGPEFWRQRTLLTNIIGAALAMHVLALAVPIFFQIVIDRVLVYLSISTLVVIGAGVVAAILFNSAFNWLRGYFILRVASRIDIRLAQTTFRHLMRLPISFFDQARAGVVTKHMQQGQQIREFLTGRLLSTLLDAPALIVFLPLLLWYSARLTLVVLGVTALLGLTIAAMLGPYRRRLRHLYQAEAQRQSLLVESVHGMRTIKSLNLEPRREEAWDNAAADAINTYVQVGKISLAANTFSDFIEKALTIAIVVTGTFLVFDGALTVGGLVAFNMLSGRVISPVLQMIGLLNNYQEVLMSVEMLGEVMNRPTEDSGQRGLTPPLAGAIEFEKVTFRYPNTERPALRDISLKIPAGAMVGIVGRSGSGKTTFSALLQGLHQTSEGAIRIDGHNIKDIDLAHLRAQNGVVPQEPFLFRGSVKDNIRMGEPTASFEDVVRAARMAGADEFIQQLPQRYDTELEEGAVNLSGGQKQRLSIARALLRQPRIIIFDEATSALDPESEAVVVKNLKDIAKGRTTIVISHRLSTIRDSDAIIVFDNGTINDVGRHDELLARNFVYHQLWSQQARTA